MSMIASCSEFEHFICTLCMLEIQLMMHHFPFSSHFNTNIYTKAVVMNKGYGEMSAT